MSDQVFYSFCEFLYLGEYSKKFTGPHPLRGGSSSSGLGRFFSGLGRAGPNFYPKKSAQAGLGPYCILQKLAQAKMGQIFLAVIVPKWTDFVSFLDQNGKFKIVNCNVPDTSLRHRENSK